MAKNTAKPLQAHNDHDLPDRMPGIDKTFIKDIIQHPLEDNEYLHKEYKKIQIYLHGTAGRCSGRVAARGHVGPEAAARSVAAFGVRRGGDGARGPRDEIPRPETR